MPNYAGTRLFLIFMNMLCLFGGLRTDHAYIHLSEDAQQDLSNCKDQDSGCDRFRNTGGGNSSHDQPPYCGDSNLTRVGILLCEQKIDTAHYRNGVHHRSGKADNWKGNDLIDVKLRKQDPQPSGRDSDQDPAACGNPDCL